MNIQKINSWFEKQAKHILHYRWIGIALFTITVAIGMSGLSKMNITTSWDDYFLEDDPMRIKTDEFKEIFGNDNFVAVLTQCDDSFTQKNLNLIRELSNELMDSVSYADKITSLTDIEYLSGTDYGMTIEQIVPPIIPNNQQALNRIRHKAYSKEKTAQRLVSKDGKYSWILLKLRTFPDTVFTNTKHKKVSAEMQTGQEVEHILTKEKYTDLHPLGTGMP